MAIKMKGAGSASIRWAPVNCGYDSLSYRYGKLYQFGRMGGCGYDDEGTYRETIIQTKNSASKDWEERVNPIRSPAWTKFYYNSASPYDWYTDGASLQQTEWPMTPPTSTSRIGNLCPDCWRVPTYEELNALTGNSGSSSIGSAGWDSTNYGYWFNGTKSPKSGEGLFLPAAGYRLDNTGTYNSREVNGRYWSSSVKESNAWGLDFIGTGARMTGYYRANGISVRCVHDVVK